MSCSRTCCHVPRSITTHCRFPGCVRTFWLIVIIFIFFTLPIAADTLEDLFWIFSKHIKPWWCIHTLKKLINIVKNEKSTLENKKNKKNGSASRKRSIDPAMPWPPKPTSAMPRPPKNRPRQRPLWSPACWRHCGQFKKKTPTTHDPRLSKKIFFQKKRSPPGTAICKKILLRHQK